MSEWTVRRTVGSASGEGADRTVEWTLAAHQGTGDAGKGGSLKVRFDVGQGGPRYWYHLGTLIHSAPEIGVLQRQRTLTLCSDLCGGTELFAFQGDAQAAPLLVQAALLWLTRDAPSTPRVFAELTGARASNDEASHCDRDGIGQSVFFNAVLWHFLPASTVDGQGLRSQWLADVAGLLPRHPLYVAMLPPHVQAQIGQAAEGARHWQTALVDEGLAAARMVSVVDAGPVHEGGLAACRTAREAAWREVTSSGDSSEAKPPLSVVMLIDNEQDMAHVVQCRYEASSLQLQERDAAARWPAGTKLWCAKGT